MVNRIATILCLLGLASPAQAIFERTARDLMVMEDALETHLQEGGTAARDQLFPMLMATPKHHWRSSAADFAPLVLEHLQRAAGQDATFIPCVECDTHRLHVRKDSAVSVHNGEIGVLETGNLQEDSRYAGAKSLAVVRETPSGVMARITSLSDGRILFYRLADSSERISGANRYLNYNTELERRKLGESLAYVFLNIGVYPQPLLQMEWVEQWGDRNQHISGLSLAFSANDTAAIGGVYHYMLPVNRKINFGLAGMVTLAGAAGIEGTTAPFVALGTVHYAFADTYAAFAGVSSGGTVTFGFSMFNPIVLPFLL